MKFVPGVIVTIFVGLPEQVVTSGVCLWTRNGAVKAAHGLRYIYECICHGHPQPFAQSLGFPSKRHTVPGD